MKRSHFTRLCLFMGTLLALLIGCSVSTSENTETAGSSETELEDGTPRLFGAELLSTEEIEEQKRGRERIPSGDERAVMYYNGVELACLGNRRVFYATVSPPAGDGTFDEGVLSGPTGYCVAINKELVPRSLSKMIEGNQTLMVYLFGETDYITAELVLTYLPVISIRIDGGNELSDYLQGARFTLHNSVTANEDPSYAESRAEVKMRGSSSKSLPKKNIRIDLKDEKGENKKMSFLDMRKDDDWILTAMFSDESKIRDMTAWQLWRDMNSYYPGMTGSCAPKTAYVEVILNGQYLGLYMLMEKFDAKTMALDEKNNDVLFKGDTWDIPDSVGLKKQSRYSLSYKGLEKKWPDPEDTLFDNSWDVMAEYIRVIYETDGKGFAAGIADVAPLSNLIDYWIFTNLIMAEDNTFKNTYYAVKNGLVYALPWDLDITFGLRWNGDAETNYVYREPKAVSQTYDFRAGRRLIQYYDGAAELLRERWTELREEGVITVDAIMENAEAYWKLIHASGAIARECGRWSSGSYANDLTYFESILEQRIDWLDEYIQELE